MRRIERLKEILIGKKKIFILGLAIAVLITAYTLVQIAENKVVQATTTHFSEMTSKLKVVLGGEACGIKILSTGVLVMGVDNINMPLKEGDILLSIDDIPIESNDDLREYINIPKVVEKEEVILTVKRGDTKFTVKVKPEQSKITGKYELGIYVKDSSAGVGIVSFYELTNNYFAGLGHGITESRQNILMPVTSGAIVRANIESIKKGYPKEPGDMRGTIYKEVVGEILLNTSNGIYGELIDLNYVKDKKEIEVASKYEIKEGKASIYLTLDNNEVSEYEIKIQKVLLDSDGNKNMVIQVIDEKLLEKTGGIVQGMSGSPIVQNGKLIGAVTHVFLNDPTRGYGVFIENMLTDMKQISIKN